MDKKVIAILPHNTVKVFYVAEEQDNLNLEGFGDGGHMQMSMPIEKYILDDCEYLIARCHSNISDDEIEEAIKNNK